MPSKSRRIVRLLAGPAEPSLPATEFKAHCAEALDAVHALGRSLLITKHGRPYARIEPAAPGPSSAYGFMAGTILAAGDLVSPDPVSWTASPDDPLERGA